MDFKAIQQNNLQTFEYCYTLDERHHKSDKFAVYIPSLMTEIGQKEPDEVDDDIERSIFINSSECNVDISTSITTQNFLEVPVFFNSNLCHNSDEHGMIPKGTKLLCMIINNDVNDIHITGFI